MYLPSDPDILLSVINTKLRDEYDSFEALCDEEDLDREAILKKLSEAGYRYDPEQNRFR